MTYVIVGASLAGANAAEALRDEGYDGRILLVGEEPERPYGRPPLSKGYLNGADERSVIYVHDEGWYDDHDVELRLGTRVEAVDRAAHEVTLAGGERLRYDKLLLTTGASPRRLAVPGGDLEGVHYLRTVGHCETLREVFKGAGQVVVVGAGWIGLETASAARGYGAEVTILEPAPTPLYSVLGPELGEVFASLHRDHGVSLRTGTGVTEIRGAGGRAAAVVTSDGTEMPADLVVVGVGAHPNTELAEASGLAVDDGVLVDGSLRTDDPAVYAAGDVANAYNPFYGRRIRVEHYANAIDAGHVAGRAMAGRGAVHDQIPFFFTDQYDLGMEYAGDAGPDEYDEIVYRGDVEGREFIAFWLRDGRVVAGMNVNVWDVNDAIQAIVRGRHQVDRAKLGDPDVPLDQLTG